MRFRIILAILILAVLCTSSRGQTTGAREAFKEGHALLQEGKYNAAITSFKLVVKDASYPLNDYAYFYTGKAYQKREYPDYAITVYKILTKHYENSILVPKALFRIAECRAQLKKYDQAIQTLRELIVKSPKHKLIPETRYQLGINLEKTGKYEEAARVYRNLDLLHPKSDFAEKSIGRLDRLAKQSPLAIYEAPAASIYNLGIKYFRKRNYTRSKEYFTRLTKFYKKSSFYDEALMMLGRIFLRKGSLNKAARYFKKSINSNKDSKPEAMLYLSLTYGYLDSPKAAIFTLEKIINRYPNHHAADDALYYIGRFHRQSDSTKEATHAYERLVAAYPNSELFPDALWLVGNFAYKEGTYRKAYEHFSQAFDLPPAKASDRLFFWAGKCADKIGDKKKAIAAYKATISDYDHSYYAYRAREELRKYGISIKANVAPKASEGLGLINGETPEIASHEEKYRELIALGLGEEAAEEAEFIAEKVPENKKGKANIAKYHAYIMKGKFAKPIWYADRKINEAMLSGNLSQVNPRLWRFSYPRGYWKYVNKYSKKYDLDPFLVYAVIREESRFKSRALSRSWAHGLMQIIPSTGRNICRALGMRYSRWKLYNPRVNIQMGTYYLAKLIKRFDGNVSYALAGYNGGPVRVKRWIKQYNHKVDIDEFIEDIPLRETRNYVKKVMKSYYGYKRTYSDG
jgi:soluble lytic murein transglycosylase